jgi:hypothetical protein
MLTQETLLAAYVALRAREDACIEHGLAPDMWIQAKREVHSALARTTVEQLRSSETPALLRRQAG